jgi:hypothetical protein
MDWRQDRQKPRLLQRETKLTRRILYAWFVFATCVVLAGCNYNSPEEEEQIRVYRDWHPDHHRCWLCGATAKQE